MQYREFNRQVLDFYLARANSAFCPLSVDKGEIEALTSIHAITEFDELASDWNKLLDTAEDIPQYFGLIAIQCYAAYNMSKDADNAGDAYQVRLRELLGLSDNNELQALFRGKPGELSAQELIWLAAQTHLMENFNLVVELPPRTTHAGRFVQYPKSQSLLITEELKRFTPFFRQEFQVNEDIPFAYFKSRIDASLINIPTTARAKELLNDPLKGEKCARQVFNFFNSWEGEIYDNISARDKKPPLKQNAAAAGSNSSLILTFDNELPAFYLLDKDSGKATQLAWESFLSSPSFNTFYSGIYLFAQTDTYCEEYSNCRFLYPDSINYILVNKNIRRRECQYLEKIAVQKIVLGGPLVLYKVHIKTAERGTALSSYIPAGRPALLFGGLKKGKGNIFIKDFGPAIGCAGSCTVLHDNRKCAYDRENSGVGLYKVRVDDYKDIEFEIIDVMSPDDIVVSRDSGWRLSNYSYDTDFDIEGCYVKQKAVENNIGTRDWINVNLGTKYSGDQILLRAISNNRQ